MPAQPRKKVKWLSKIEDILSDILKALNQNKKEKTRPYDTTATVTRVEGSTAYVHIPGGVDETPVTMSINCKAGDTVNVRVSGGRAWITGNSTAPPTDDSTAKEALDKADQASADAAGVVYLVKDAQTAAENAAKSSAGKSAAYWQATEPTGSFNKYDIWFDTGNGNQIHYWDGSQWVAKQWGTVAIGDGAVIADKLAVGSVTANKIDVNDLFAQYIKATGTIEGLTLKGISVEGSYAHFGSAIFFRLPKNQNVWANALWTNIEEDSPTANKIMLGLDFDQVAIAAWTSLQSGLTVAGTSEFKLASTFNGNIVINSTINGNKYQYVTTESKTGLNLSIAANGYQNISGYLPTKSGYTLAAYSVRCTGTNGAYVVHPGMGSPYILNTYSSAVTVTALNFTCVWTKT